MNNYSDIEKIINPELDVDYISKIDENEGLKLNFDDEENYENLIGCL